MLCLADRVLLALQAAPTSARQLARDLGADVQAVHGVLRGLEAQGAVVEQAVPREGSRWRLAPGVRLVYRPPSVVVEGATPLLPLPRPADRCRAVMTRGKPCRLRAAAEGLCFLHRPR